MSKDIEKVLKELSNIPSTSGDEEAVVDYLKNEKDWPDQMANIPTMPAAYTAALWREVYNSLGLSGFLPDPASLHVKNDECN